MILFTNTCSQNDCWNAKKNYPLKMSELFNEHESSSIFEENNFCHIFGGICWNDIFAKDASWCSCWSDDI